MREFCDLHTHSYYSDGSCSPAELLRVAEKAGLGAIVLSDHNTVAGLPEFLQAGQDSPVEAVPGIEFSTEFEGEELHILGIFLPPERFGEIGAMLEQLHIRKQRSERELVERLRQAGMDLSYEQIRGATPRGNVNRAHIASQMVEKGYVSSYQEAFSGWLSPERGLYVPPKRLDAYETIRYIKSIGAVAVLAHPYLSLKDDEKLHRFLEEAVGCGLDGMETLYPKYDEATTAKAQALAKELGLLPSGGSDFHGKNKPDIQMGTGRGSLQVPLSILDALRQRAGTKKITNKYKERQNKTRAKGKKE